MAVRPASYREVLRHSEFRFLLAATLVSVVGDQVARVALSVLVLDRTGSPLMSAAIFGASYLPWVVGGPLLSTLADRLPPRAVLVSADLVRAVVVSMLLVPGLPVWALIGMIFLSELAAPPFDSTKSALTPQLLTDDSYVVGSSVMSALNQGAQVFGFAAGGVVLTVLHPSGALVADALTFVLSALLLLRLRSRPAPDDAEAGSLLRGAADGFRAVWGTRRIRALVLFGWLTCALAVVPEGLAAPYAREMGRGAHVVGLLLAAAPLGSALGGLGITRLVSPARRLRLLVPMTGLSAAPLLVAALDPPPPFVLAAFFLAGLGSSSLVLVSTTVGQEVGTAMRGRVFGIAASGLMIVQGGAVMAGGALASALPVHDVVALTGVAGLALGAMLALFWFRLPGSGAPQPVPPLATGAGRPDPEPVCAESPS